MSVCVRVSVRVRVCTFRWLEVCTSHGYALPHPPSGTPHAHTSPDYKSSVMAGLKPDIIMDIAGRALNFWVGPVQVDACVWTLWLCGSPMRTRMTRSLAGVPNHARGPLQ